MSDTAVVVWSHWDLHADALVSVLRQDGLAARVVSTPGEHAGLLVAEAVRVDDLVLLEERASAGRRTIVWGGTLPAPRIAALQEAGPPPTSSRCDRRASWSPSCGWCSRGSGRSG